jgi:hypothetical protein
LLASHLRAGRQLRAATLTPRATGGDNYFIDWETLTHAQLGMVGIP